MNAKTPLALEGVRVVDAASLFAGPVICTMLGDHGADVIKVEHPSGDNLRKLGWEKDGVSLWWALIGRNKRSVTLKLSDPEGAEAMKKLLADRRRVRGELPHRHARALGPRSRTCSTRSTRAWSSCAPRASARPGPYATRPGFGTLAESISGLPTSTAFPTGRPRCPRSPSATGWPLSPAPSRR